MDVEVRYIERTGLNLKSFIKVVKRYASSLQHPIRVVFDMRLVNYGQYDFDNNKLHVIRISPTLTTDPREYIRTMLHELKHAHQRHKLGSKKASSKSFIRASKKHELDDEGADYNSPCEVEAREYEKKYTQKAFNYYIDCCKQTCFVV